MEEVIGEEIVSCLDKVPKKDYKGRIYWWDLDNTYLSTRFERISDLIKIPFESAQDKVSAPGAAVLIRELRRGPYPDKLFEDNFIYFLTSSPPQLGKEVEEKLRLDGLELDGILYKDFFDSILRGKFRRLKEQIGFKLGTLLSLRHHLPKTARETLFGDDTLSDALVYSLYSDISGGRLGSAQLLNILDKFNIIDDDKDLIVTLATEVHDYDPVDRVYIYLVRDTDPKYFDCFGGLIIPVYDYFQAALHLFQEGKISIQGVVNVGTDFMNRFGYKMHNMVETFFEFYLRGYLTDETVCLVEDVFTFYGIFPEKLRFKFPFKTRFNVWRRKRGKIKDAVLVPKISRPVDYGRV